MKLRSGKIVGLSTEGNVQPTEPCLICLEVVQTEVHKCSQCTGTICAKCMKNYAASCVKDALDKGAIPSMPCPQCRIANWKEPQTFVSVPGGAFTEDVSFRVEVPWRDRYYYVHGIHDNDKFVGFVVLHHLNKFAEQEHSFHIDDIDMLTAFAMPINCLYTRFMCRIITEDDIIDHVAQVFKDAGAMVGVPKDDSFCAGNIHKLFLNTVNPF